MYTVRRLIDRFRRSNHKNDRQPDSIPRDVISVALSPEQFALLQYVLVEVMRSAGHSLVADQAAEVPLTKSESAHLAEIRGLADLLHEEERKLFLGSDQDGNLLRYIEARTDSFLYFDPLGHLLLQRMMEGRRDAEMTEVRSCFDSFQRAASEFALNDDWAGLEAWLQTEKVSRESILRAMQKIRLPLF